MLKFILEKLVGYFSIFSILLCVVMATLTYTVIYAYTGPYDDDKMLLMGLSITIVAYLIVTACVIEFKKYWRERHESQKV